MEVTFAGPDDPERLLVEDRVVDGEMTVMRPPLSFRIRPGLLRLLVPST